MTPDQIARRYEDMPGYELLDYAEAALPLWQLNVEAVSVIRRGLQPIKEFVVRSLEQGLSAADLSGFLGLEDSVVTGALADLLADGFISTKGGPVVTESGRKALREGLSTPTEEVLSILFDGIVRKPIASLEMDLALPRDVEEGELAEIPATPANQPSIADLSLPDIDQVLLEQLGGRYDLNRDILRVKRIARYRRVFRKAIAMVFRSKTGEVKMRFIVNGVPDEHIEQRFAEHGGNLRKGLVRAFSESHLQANLRAHLGQEAARKVLEPEDYRSRQRQVSMASLKVAALRRREGAAERGEIPRDQGPSEAEIRAALEAEAAARSAIMQPSARPAAVYELAELLQRALVEPQKSLSISTRGLAPHIVDRAFISALDRLLNRNVHVSILVNEEAEQWRSRGKEWARAYDDLHQRALKAPQRLTVRLSKEARYYHLSWDGKLTLVVNRPILSNQGRTRSFDQFAGYVIQAPDLIDGYLDRIAGR